MSPAAAIIPESVVLRRLAADIGAHVALAADDVVGARELRHAMNSGELELHYQPQFRVHDRALVGAEALVRWRHPDRGLVSPVEFVGLCERTGLLGALSELTIDQACAQLAAWDRDGVHVPRVGVNINVCQLADGDLAAVVAGALARHDVRPCRLELEVTETGTETEPARQDRAFGTLHALRAVGVALTVDDFGVGFSSMLRLMSFPWDGVKIDRAFLADIGEGSAQRACFRAIVGLGAELGVSVLAEGVETEDQLRVVADSGCELCSGWLFSAALEPAVFAERHAANFATGG